MKFKFLHISKFDCSLLRLTGGTVLDRILSTSHFSEKVRPCHTQTMKDCSLPSWLQESAMAMIDVLHAVQYLHEVGLVHRDLKAVFHPTHSLASLVYISTLFHSPRIVTFRAQYCQLDTIRVKGRAQYCQLDSIRVRGRARSCLSFAVPSRD